MSADANIRFRRKQVQDMLFSRLGTPNFTFPAHTTIQNGIIKSLFFVNEAIFRAHLRFQTLTKPTSICLALHRGSGGLWRRALHGVKASR